MSQRHFLLFLPFFLTLFLFSTPTQAGGGGTFPQSYLTFYNQAEDYCIQKMTGGSFPGNCEDFVKYCLNKLFECSVKTKDYSCVIINGNEISCLKFPSDCEPPDLTAEIADYKSLTAKDPCPKPTDALSLHKPGCGNGVLEPDEDCDDGNLKNGDTCPKDCQIPTPSLCGNGNLDPPNEECDAGANNGNVESGCDLHCKKITAPTTQVSANTSTDSSAPPASTTCSLHPGERPLSPFSSLLVLSPVILLLLKKKVLM